MSDNSSINSTEWENELKEKILSLSQKTIKDWCATITKMGVPKDVVQHWSNVFVGQVDQLYKDMLEDINSNYEKLLNSIEHLLQEASIRCKNLQIKMPQYGAQDLSLHEEKKLLQERIEEYNKLIAERQKEVTKLNQRQKDLCDALGRELKIIPESPLPTDEFFVHFNDYLENLESERFNRTEKFLAVKSSVIELAEKLNYKPDLDFQRTVMSSNDTIFLLTDENMNNLEEFYDSLRLQYEKVKEDIASEKEKIKELWEMLRIDRKYCDDFLEKHTDIDAETLKALKIELKRCEEIKCANIEICVKQLRINLEELWNKCHFTEKQREEFIYFNYDFYTDDLLSLHHLEVKKVQQYYDANNEIFTLLEKHQELWVKLIELENREIAPDRYQNRGGRLLKEEKERNTLSKQIPKIESKLLELVETYEAENGKHFLSWGNTVQDMLQNIHEHREQEKKIKLSARKQKRDKTLTPGKSTTALSRCASSQNLKQLTSTSVKRKLIITPLVASKRKCLLGDNNNVPQSVPEIQVNSRPVGSSRYSTERAKRLKKCIKRLSQRYQKENQRNMDTNPDYDSFETALSNKGNCRSTMCNVDNDLAQPLPRTPCRPPLCTPRHTPRAGKSPQTASKLTAAPSLTLLF